MSSMSKQHQQTKMSFMVVSFLAFLIQASHGWTGGGSTTNNMFWKNVGTKRNGPHHQHTSMTQPQHKKCHHLSMDIEGPPTPFVIPFWNNKQREPKQQQQQQQQHAWKKLEQKYGMPWKSPLPSNATEAINNNDNNMKNKECTFMPFWEWQSQYFQQHLTNFQVLPTSFEYIETEGHRMVTLCAMSDEYRWIRMTYLDGAASCQIFTSVCYPRGNHPLLGLDFLQFHNKKHLVIADFQPLHHQHSEHTNYQAFLQQLQKTTPSLQQPISNRFFDPSKYFSGHTLMGRFETKNIAPADVSSSSPTTTTTTNPIVSNELFPAVQSMIQYHVDMVQKSKTPHPNVLQWHQAYDTYLARVDPARPMFTKLFGAAFAESFLHQILFPLAKQEKEEEPEGNITTTTTSSSTSS